MEDLKKYTVLVVDDEEVLRDTIIFDLKRKGFNTLSAENGSQAFEIVKTNEIHLIVSDLRMPGGDGLSLLEKVRTFSSELPVIVFMTGFADLSEEECKKRGARYVIHKPFDRKLFMNVIFESLGILGSIPIKVV